MLSQNNKGDQLMMESFVRWQQKWANWKVITVLLILFILMQIVILPSVSNKLNNYSNNIGIIDLQLTYTVDKVYEMAEAYGDEGRRFYIVNALTGDVVYPIIYSLLFSLGLTILYRRVFHTGSALHKLPLLVYLVLLFDILENAAIITIMVNLPERLTTVAQLSNVFTMAKWAMAGVIILMIIIGLLLLPFKRAKQI
jgi:hypothetical protein